MSDTQDEPFDKEAEKEKLRQQLAEEEADREATQHMSDLLLKGATMTNKHCDECGDPLFRHDGREFCPTCGRQRAAGGGADAEAGGAQAEGTTQPPESGGTTAGEQAATSGSEAGTETQRETPAPPQRSPSADRTGSSPPQYTGEADLPEARQALARKVTALAREAEATTDVGRARELLAAVREGAEALRALERSGR